MSTVGKEIDVTYEDQLNINAFNRLNHLAKEYQGEIDDYSEEINKISDAGDEIYITNEIKYVVGESFFDIDQNSVEELLEKEKKDLKKIVDSRKVDLEKVQNKMKQIKGTLYAKFGNQINLDEDRK